MQYNDQIAKWHTLFPAIARLPQEEKQIASENIQFLELRIGDIAYLQGGDCPNYLMCLSGQTRIFKRSPSGKEILIYRVGSGGTCVLTTQCLLTDGKFPAESIADTHVQLAALPANKFHELIRRSEAFRQFVFTDYTRLLGGVIDLVDQLAFRSIEERLSLRLLADADENGIVRKTHQQLASELGCVREVVSRHLSIWETNGWVQTTRGAIEILDQESLATKYMNNPK